MADNREGKRYKGILSERRFERARRMAARSSERFEEIKDRYLGFIDTHFDLRKPSEHSSARSQ